MRPNLGCGNRKREGWHNVDKVADCEPDEIVDLESLPWPWRDNSVDEITEADVQHAQATYSNVISQTTIVMKAIKPAGRPG